MPPERVSPGFVTDTGIAVPAVNTAEMRELDRIATEETGPNLFQMMENAGRNLAQLAIEVLAEGWQAAKIVVLAGPGGNGGGGICAARHLANRRASVVLILSDPDHLGDVPGFQRKIFRETQGREVRAAQGAGEPADLILDALIGYGLRDAPRGTAADLIRWANGTGAPNPGPRRPLGGRCDDGGDAGRGDQAPVDDDAGPTEDRVAPGQHGGSDSG